MLKLCFNSNTINHLRNDTNKYVGKCKNQLQQHTLLHLAKWRYKKSHSNLDSRKTSGPSHRGPMPKIPTQLGCLAKLENDIELDAVGSFARWPHGYQRYGENPPLLYTEDVEN